MNNRDLKQNILHRATIFIEKIGEFAPFGVKNVNGVIKDIVYQTDETEEVDSSNAISLIERSFTKDLKDGAVQAVAIAFDVSANFPNSDGISEKRDALCLKISTDGESWDESYYPYMIIDGECVWK